MADNAVSQLHAKKWWYVWNKVYGAEKSKSMLHSLVEEEDDHRASSCIPATAPGECKKSVKSRVLASLTSGTKNDGKKLPLESLPNLNPDRYELALVNWIQCRGAFPLNRVATGTFKGSIFAHPASFSVPRRHSPIDSAVLQWCTHPVLIVFGR
jgi:hypothetical protein